MTTLGGVRTEAQLERDRLAIQRREAEQEAQRQAAEGRERVAAQAEEARQKSVTQAREAQEKARAEALSQQAIVRKSQGEAEREAESLKGQAREARQRELRKQDLPFTRLERSLVNIVGYVASVEVARVKAHKEGRSARTEIEGIKDEYVAEVDKELKEALADIEKQKLDIDTDIARQLMEAQAEIFKQVAIISSGIDEWEADANAAINKAQNDYEAAIRAQLDRPGTEVFSDMQSQGLVPANAIYKDYDKTTGQLNYTIPDTRTGQEIFSAEQAAGNIPDDATYKDYNKDTGQVSYTVPKKAETQTATNTTAPGKQGTNVVANAGGIALAGAAVMTMTQAGAGIAAIPTPPTWAIGGSILVAALIAGLIERERIAQGIKKLVGNRDQGASSAVITDNSGAIVYSTAQIRILPQEKGGNILVSPQIPLEKAAGPDIGEVKVRPLPGFGLLAEGILIESIPTLRNPPNVMIRDPFDVPELRQKGSNIVYAAAAVQTAANAFTGTAQRELSISREKSERLFEQINEYLRQNRVSEGRRILEDNKSLSLAYQDYLRKKAILDAARKSYVASLDPQPIKGKGSANAKAAAVGVWLVQDILQDAIQKALNRGETLKSAMIDAQAKATLVTKELGLTQQQVNAANATVVYQAALSAMTQQAIQTATQGRTQGLTNTELQTRVFNATKTAAQTVTQTAVQTNTLTQTQAQSMTNELTRVAAQVAELTMRIKLEKAPSKEATLPSDETYPAGTIVWQMGELRRGGEWKIIPPPYTLRKPISSTVPPKGVKRLSGTPQETLCFIGGKLPFKNVAFDLGVVDGYIDVKRKRITFTGEGLKTDVGKRIPSLTKGITLSNRRLPRRGGQRQSRRTPSRTVTA